MQLPWGWAACVRWGGGLRRVTRLEWGEGNRDVIGSVGETPLLAWGWPWR